MKFRKKPVVIEASQWFKDGDHPAVKTSWATPEGVTDNPEWADTWGRLAQPFPAIHTLEGRMEVTPGDWIITGVRGEHYPCKDGIFQETYEAAE